MSSYMMTLLLSFHYDVIIVKLYQEPHPFKQEACTGLKLIMEREVIGSSCLLWASNDDNVLFDDSFLQQLDCTKFSCHKKYGISIQSPGAGLVLRSLHLDDYDKGHVQLLSQLTSTGDVTQDRYKAQFNAMKQCPGVYYVIVIEDTTTSQVIASGTLLIERKFTHNAALRGRVEDIVVDKEYRGRHLGALVVETATALSVYLGCYKISLDCSPNVKEFYKQFGYDNGSELFLYQRFFD